MPHLATWSGVDSGASTLRRVSALGVSAALHLLCLVGANWLAFQAPIAARAIRAASHRTPVVVQVPELQPSQPSNRTHTSSDDLGIRLDDRQSTLVIEGFTFGLRKIVDHAASLFPFLSREFSIDAIVATPHGSGDQRLSNPF